jgi:alkylhydroperoxidase/carboxymuconolactone decarboxylase family protein YurZ
MAARLPIPKNYAAMKKQHPELIGAYEALGEACKNAGPLDAKASALVKLALAIGCAHEGGTHSAVRKAMEAGCSADELLHVATLGTTTLGFPAMMRARSWVQDVLEGKR